MSGEDSYLYYKMRQAGITVWYTPAAVVQHVIPAYRLQEEYFRWTCMRHGWNAARLFWRECGILVCLLIFTARLVQAAAMLAPLLLWARLRGNEERALAIRCRLWRAEGYVRGTLRWAAPRWFAQESHAAQARFPHRTATICFTEPRAMKVLLCHNYYLQAGGEDVVFADEGAMLEEHGHQVVRYTLHNNIIEKMPRWQARAAHPLESAELWRAARADSPRASAAHALHEHVSVDIARRLLCGPGRGGARRAVVAQLSPAGGRGKPAGPRRNQRRRSD